MNWYARYPEGLAPYDQPDDGWPRHWYVPDDTLEMYRDYPDLLKRLTTLAPALNQHLDQLALVVALIRDTCPHCYTDNKSCQCSNDE